MENEKKNRYKKLCINEVDAMKLLCKNDNTNTINIDPQLSNMCDVSKKLYVNCLKYKEQKINKS